MSAPMVVCPACLVNGVMVHCTDDYCCPDCLAIADDVLDCYEYIDEQPVPLDVEPGPAYYVAKWRAMMTPTPFEEAIVRHVEDLDLDPREQLGNTGGCGGYGSGIPGNVVIYPTDDPGITYPDQHLDVGAVVDAWGHAFKAVWRWLFP